MLQIVCSLHNSNSRSSHLKHFCNCKHFITILRIVVVVWPSKLVKILLLLFLLSIISFLHKCPLIANQVLMVVVVVDRCKVPHLMEILAKYWLSIFSNKTNQPSQRMLAIIQHPLRFKCIRHLARFYLPPEVTHLHCICQISSSSCKHRIMQHQQR